MIPASGAYRNITGAQHAIHGAKPGEYSLIQCTKIKCGSIRNKVMPPEKAAFFVYTTRLK